VFATELGRFFLGQKPNTRVKRSLFSTATQCNDVQIKTSTKIGLLHQTINFKPVLCRSLEGLGEKFTFSALIFYQHYERSKIPRVSHASPSAKNRALEEVNLPRVLHSGKQGFPECRKVYGTRERPSSSSATLEEERHSRNKICI
jgi:hypothetical protein